jgi:hypothetical protein
VGMIPRDTIAVVEGELFALRIYLLGEYTLLLGSASAMFVITNTQTQTDVEYRRRDPQKVPVELPELPVRSPEKTPMARPSRG